MVAADPLHAALERFFGYSSFRPLQEEIMRDALAGRDVLALLPTGAGKSLCFQLPAVLREGLTVVVSPLIALMKDQVDALTAAGVPATYLNSSLDPDEARERCRALRGGRFRLLYAAPERLVLPGFLALLKEVGIGAVAVDEAHCISAWGHDFRPEYRQIAALRDLFPDAPIMALTATATPRVRDDIAASLRLRAPRIHLGSFDRPNLLYQVEPKTRALTRILELVRSRPGASGIVYTLSRAGAERLAEGLCADGVRAAAYHAGLEAPQRDRVQEAFARDRVRVVCATVAFGMGIDKPDVRFVVHHDLPKDLESYYQETGRAGRDGLPSECLLLFRPGDAARLERFLDEKPDPEERARAREKLAQMVDFAEARGCRRAALLAYFGERSPPPPCRGCDNCLAAPAPTAPAASAEATEPPSAGTTAAHKLLSAVLRVRARTGRACELRAAAEVLIGSRGERVRRLGLADLPTYGAGRELTRARWMAVGRELERLGLLRLSGRGHLRAEVTERGCAVLRGREAVPLGRPTALPLTPAERDLPPCDEALMDRLRLLRREIADARGVPSYVVFGDASLREMARAYPVDTAAFRAIPGVGDKKLADFGPAFLQAIGAHLSQHGRRAFGEAEAAAATW